MKSFIQWLCFAFFVPSLQAVELPNNVVLPKIQVEVIGATWCPQCRKLNRDLLAKGVFPPGTNLEVPETVDGKFTQDILGISENVTLRIINLDKISKERLSEVGKKYGAVDGVPMTFISIGDEDIVKVVATDLSTIQFAIERIYKVALLMNGQVDPLFASPKVSKKVKELDAFQPGNGGAAVLLGAASEVESNPIFTSQVLSEIRSTLLQEGGLAPQSIVTVFGSDSQKPVPAVVGRSSQGKPVIGDSVDVGLRVEGNRVSLLAVARKLQEQKPKNTLFLIAGHGSSEGALLWEERAFMRLEMASLVKAVPGKVVTVSGTCHSGVYANQGSCGFYAARPERLASGCYEFSEKRINREDYATKFFDSLTDLQGSDSNHDGEVSFKEAHWYAVSKGYLLDAPYTDLDYLADDLIEKAQEKEGSEAGSADIISFSKLLQLSDYGSEEERNVLVKVLKRNTFANPDNVDVFMALAGNNPRDLFETVIVQKSLGPWGALMGFINSGVGLSQKHEPKLVHLARRFFARKLIAESSLASEELKSRWNDVEACENQGIKGFLQGR